MVRETANALFLRYRSRIAILMLVLVWSYFLVAFGEQSWRARELQAEVDTQRASIAVLADRNAQLQQQADRFATDAYLDYVQAIARRDLGLANQGETVLLVRWQASPAVIEETTVPTEVDERPNWKRWLNAFSGG